MIDYVTVLMLTAIAGLLWCIDGTLGRIARAMEERKP